MPKRYIILKPIGNNKGGGVVTLFKDTVTVSLSGTEEEFALYFMSSAILGNELKINAGTIKGGFAKSFTLKEDDVKKIDTVVLLKGSEPLIYGSLAPLMPEININNDKSGEKKEGPDIGEGFLWIKVEDGRFAENLPIIRHIFENINVLYKINSLGYYYYGTKGTKAVVAIPSSADEKNPFTHISDCARYIGGCWTVGAEKKEKYFYSLTD